MSEVSAKKRQGSRGGKSTGSSRMLGMTDEGKRVTSYDVARVAGVSQSAVSRCFKPGASVSKKMRDKVMTVAKELGFQPNAIARSLISGRSNMVAVIINNFTNLYYPELLVQLSRGFDERGVHVLLFTLEHESDVDKMLDQVWQYQVDGVISAARLSEEQVSFFEERGVPLVFYNRSFQDYPVSAICCNQEEGERVLVNKLDAAGHKAFSIITGPTDSMVSNQRTQGALNRLKELGKKSVPVVEGDYGYDSGRAAFRELMESKKKIPDAVICANDVMAIGCMDAARHEFDLRVPEDVSIVGFDGTSTGAWSSYRLTTIDQPLEIMAEAAVSMLMDRVENRDLPPEKRSFSGVFLEGESARLG